MKKTPSIQPIASHCLIEKTESRKNVTDSGIELMGVVNHFSEGIVVSMGNKLSEDKELFDKDLNLGSKVLYDERNVIYEEPGEAYFLIPYNSIVAIIDKGVNATSKDDTSFFDIPEWKQFKGEDSESWLPYTNIKSFNVRSLFLTPFLNLDPLHKLAHEIIFETLKHNVPEISLSSIKSQIVENEKGVKSYITLCDDDVWGCGFTLSTTDDGFHFDFLKNQTDVQTICKTGPILLSAYHNIIKSNLFKRYSEPDFSKTKRLTITFDQEIKLNFKGIGKHQVKNSDIMQQFLMLKSDQDKKSSALLESLAFNPESIGRIDLTLSFDKQIRNNSFHVFMYLTAPSNDNNSLINAKWAIVNDNPGIIYEENLGEVFEDFFRDTILKAFYNQWFTGNEINISTLKK
ncbi:MAG: co-chaperone GroES family protein [bacterium]|nr:co-chaperone GroES family protein [bacterium]